MSILEKLAAIQSTLEAPKDQYNTFGKYKYRSLEGIMKAVKPLLKEHGCVLTISDKMIAVGERVYVEATAILAMVEDSEKCVTVRACAREAATKKGMDDAQITGAASSYARKYACNGLFAIDDTKDPDASNKHGKGEEEKHNPKLLNELMAQVDKCTSEAKLTDWWRANEKKINLLNDTDYGNLKTACGEYKAIFKKEAENV